FDVLVVGMGATGAGVALDAASRGLRVVAVDRADLAAGTSSKSSKLIHGGLRYLESYQFGLVFEGVKERQLLRELAPHLVRPMGFLYPVWPDTAKRRLLRVGLHTYDVFAGMRNVRRHTKISPEEAVALAPALAGTRLCHAFVYGDCATDDARLVLAVVQAARRFGALTLPYMEATDLLRDAGGTVVGARTLDRLDGRGYELRARHVVNATGVWVDQLMSAADAAHQPAVQPSKGVHLVLPHERLPLREASILLPSRQGDGRSMFAIPWGRQTILGTTDTPYDGPLDALSIEQDDLDYVLAAGNAVFRLGLTQDDVVAAWAGVRPLLKGKGAKMSDLSRRHALIEGAGGLVSITGGKLTAYRRMAADVVDLLVARDGRRAPCRTQHIPLGCARQLDDVVFEAEHAAKAVGLDAEVAELLVRQHGEHAPDVLALVADDPSLGRALSPAAAHVAAEVVHAGRHEGAATLDDVFSRRTRLALRARDAALPVARQAAGLLAAEIGRDDAWADAQVEAYASTVRWERGVLGLVATGPVPPEPVPA
ncbi:MAG TPA: glycerol-3-phosphate dehydrogenase/oxidase, partial [Frankiaceae bacterium]|nr:glycerol-3-phosphate dehydrogenase/oxidase [Frankiaceae bacterium]